MDPRCRVELLGRLRVTQGDREITRFCTQKTGALLGYLTYYLQRTHPHEVPTDILSRGVRSRADLLRVASCLGSATPTHPQGG